MLIVARGGATYARLQFGVGPRGVMEIPVEVDYGREFSGSDWPAWQVEYAACVVARPDIAVMSGVLPADGARNEEWPERDRWLDDARLWKDPNELEEYPDDDVW
jgi:hypothetical protein